MGVKILVEHKADVNMPGEDDYTPLMLAGGHDDIETVKTLLKAPGIDVNGRSAGDGKSALLWAAENGHRRTVQLLVEQEKERINMNVQDSNGYTALMWSADNGHVGCVSALLQHPGLDVNVLDSDGHSALTWACDQGHTEIVKLLLGNQSLKIDVVDNEGYSPFICAASSGRSKVFSLLLNDERTNVNIKDNYRNTALHVAVEEDAKNSHSGGHKEIVEALLKCPRFTERESKNDQKKTAEMIARASKKKPNHLLNLLGNRPEGEPVPKMRKK